MLNIQAKIVAQEEASKHRTVAMSFTLPRYVTELLRAKSQETGFSMSNLVAQALLAKLETK